MLTSEVGWLRIKPAESCVGGPGKCCYGVADLKALFMLEETRLAWAELVLLPSI